MKSVVFSGSQHSGDYNWRYVVFTSETPEDKEALQILAGAMPFYEKLKHATGLHEELTLKLFEPIATGDSTELRMVLVRIPPSQ
ncbi:MAG: hypothetical protein Q7S36_00730 [Candidatus Liptonbacteria bacterium]|nr:hypothetical protein [Candidatus Liptonbacteria bacterium]